MGLLIIIKVIIGVTIVFVKSDLKEDKVTDEIKDNILIIIKESIALLDTIKFVIYTNKNLLNRLSGRADTNWV